MTTSTAMRAPVSHDRWEARQGGVVTCGAECDRANVALQRVSGDLPAGVVHATLAVHVLDTALPVAYSFPDGAVYVTRGLVGRLDDDELAATVAHELGHLLHEGVIESPAMLRGAAGGGGSGGDIEKMADLLGRELLIQHHISTNALPSALEKVATASRGTGFYSSLEERVAILRKLDRSEAR